MSGRIKAEILVAGRPRTRVGRQPGRRRRCPTECKIDNNVSRDFTVVEVITEDRPGVLYAIARALYVAGLDIHRSKIATEANRAIDVFYVRDKATMDKIIDPERQASLRETLLASAGRTSTAPKLAGSRLAQRSHAMPTTILMLALLALAEGGGRGAAAREGREAVQAGRRRRARSRPSTRRPRSIPRTRARST